MFISNFYLTAIMAAATVSLGTAAKISFFPSDNFQGNPTVMEFENSTCYNLNPSINNYAESINTHDNCIMAYDHSNCDNSGRMERIGPGTPIHYHLASFQFENRISSFRKCPLNQKPYCVRPNITVNISKATEDVKKIGVEMRNTLNNWFPQFCYLLHSSSFQDLSRITIEFQESMEDWPDIVDVSVTNKLIRANADYYRSNPNDKGSIIHQMVHIIQQYSNQCPGWIVEGMADWVRYYHFEPVAKQPSKPSLGATYTDGNTVSAYFLNWISRGHGTVIYRINMACRDGTYADSNFVNLTGKTLNQLWQEMMAS